MCVVCVVCGSVELGSAHVKCMIQFVSFEACDARVENASFTNSELLFQVTEGEIGLSQRWEHGAVHREPCIVTKMDCEGRTIDDLRKSQGRFQHKTKYVCNLSAGKTLPNQIPDLFEKRVRVATRPSAKALGGLRRII